MLPIAESKPRQFGLFSQNRLELGVWGSESSAANRFFFSRAKPTKFRWNLGCAADDCLFSPWDIYDWGIYGLFFLILFFWWFLKQIHEHRVCSMKFCSIFFCWCPRSLFAEDHRSFSHWFIQQNWGRVEHLEIVCANIIYNILVNKHRPWKSPIFNGHIHLPSPIYLPGSNC